MLQFKYSSNFNFSPFLENLNCVKLALSSALRSNFEAGKPPSFKFIYPYF